MDALRFHLGGKVCKTREALRIHRKVLVMLHVINIQNHSVQRHIIGTVICHHLADLVLVHVAPAALGALALNDVEIVIFLGHRDA